MPAEYSIDTCALNDFLQPGRNYDRAVFVSHWNFLNESCLSGRVISHIEVYDEIMLGDVSDATIWASENKRIFLNYNFPDESDLVTRIGEKYPQFLWQKKTSLCHADPWLIAQAKLSNLKIITSEKENSPARIPYIASQFGVKTVSVVSFLKENGIGK